MLYEDEVDVLYILNMLTLRKFGERDDVISEFL